MKSREQLNPSAPSVLRALPGLTGRFESLLNRPAQRIRELTERALVPLRITPKQYAVLAAVFCEGPATQRDIGEKLKIDRTTMVLLADGLEDRGLLVRNDHPKDRRVYLLNLTASGKTLFKKADALVLKAEKAFLKPLSADEQRRLRDSLSKLFHDIPGAEDGSGPNNGI